MIYLECVHSYIAHNAKELSIDAGEVVLLLDNRKRWWQVENSNGVSGFVPSTYLADENGLPAPDAGLPLVRRGYYAAPAVPQPDYYGAQAPSRFASPRHAAAAANGNGHWPPPSAPAHAGYDPLWPHQQQHQHQQQQQGGSLPAPPGFGAPPPPPGAPALPPPPPPPPAPPLPSVSVETADDDDFEAASGSNPLQAALAQQKAKLGKKKEAAVDAKRMAGSSAPEVRDWDCAGCEKERAKERAREIEKKRKGHSSRELFV